MNTKAIADDVVALAKAGDLDAIGARYWADDVVSIEAFESPMSHLQGKQAVLDKQAWWNGAHDVHSVETHGPYVNGDQFAVRWVMDVTSRETSQRMTMDEVAVFTVANGKIVEERFFY